jgi:hypothetical protein
LKDIPSRTLRPYKNDGSGGHEVKCQRAEAAECSLALDILGLGRAHPAFTRQPQFWLACERPSPPSAGHKLTTKNLEYSSPAWRTTRRLHMILMQSQVLLGPPEAVVRPCHSLILLSIAEHNDKAESNLLGRNDFAADAPWLIGRVSCTQLC